jgi:hypothetical protein
MNTWQTEAISTCGIEYSNDNDQTWTLVSAAPGEGPYTLERRDGAYTQYTELFADLVDAIASAEEIAPLSQWEAAVF